MTPGRLTQQDAARLMAAHAKVVEAQKTHLTAFRRSVSFDWQAYLAAEAAFAELVGELTLKEGE
jgi:hypothetical protein